jgi:hypothetical protein
LPNAPADDLPQVAVQKGRLARVMPADLGEMEI